MGKIDNGPQGQGLMCNRDVRWDDMTDKSDPPPENGETKLILWYFVRSRPADLPGMATNTLLWCILLSMYSRELALDPNSRDRVCASIWTCDPGN